MGRGSGEKIDAGPWLFVLGMYGAAALFYFSPDIDRTLWKVTVGVLACLLIYLIVQFIKDLRFTYGSSRISSYVHIAVFSALLVSSIVVPLTVNVEYSHRLEPFQATLSAYSAVVPVQQDGEKPSPGKAVVVDRASGEMDESLYFKLPDGMIAKKPEDVKTVVLVERGKRETGRYDSGAKAYVHTCKVTVVDFSTQITLAEESFEGSAPPGTIYGSGDGYGSLPNEDVITYLKKILGS